MAFDYILWRDCGIQQGRRPKAVIDDNKLRDMVAYAQQNEQAMLARNPGKTLDEISVTSRAGDGSEKITTFGDIRRRWEDLLARADNECPDCPLNFRDRPLGCIAAIIYPIPASLEKWAVDHFNPPAHCASGILGFIHDNGAELTGERADSLRPPERGDRALLAAPAPFTRTLTQAKPIQLINYPDPEPEISSSQIVELLLSADSPGPLLLWSFCLEFGAIEAAPEDCARMIQLLTPSFMDMLPKPNAEGGMTFTTYMESGNTLGGQRCGPFTEEGTREFQEIIDRCSFVLQTDEDDDEGSWRFKLFLNACWVCLTSGIGRMMTDG